MPIIPTIGRRSIKMRLLIIFVYAVLVLGSATTVYPFIIMLSTSVSSKTDYEEYRLIPRYLTDPKAFTAKYLEEKYRREYFDFFKLRYRLEEPYWAEISPEKTVSSLGQHTVTKPDGTSAREWGWYTETKPAQKVLRWYGRFTEMRPVLRDFDVNEPGLKARVGDWLEFKKTLPYNYMDTYFHSYGVPVGEVEVGFQQFLKKKYPAIPILREALGEMQETYADVNLPFEAYERHAWYPGPDQKSRDLLEFRKTLPPRAMNPMDLATLYDKYLVDAYGKDIAALNRAWGTSYKYFWEAPFPPTKPSDGSARDWEEFVRRKMPMRFGRLDPAICRDSYIQYLRDNFRDVSIYNAKMGDSAASFEDVKLGEYMPEKTLELAYWQAYYETKAPIEGIIIDSVDGRYAKFLEAKYGDVAAMNKAYGASAASFAEAAPPWREEDYLDLSARRTEIKWDYLTRNYIYVLKRVFLQGRPLFNTFALVTLIVLTQITINPLAAYALSRYRLKYTGKVLIFMLATMAFPAEVAMIPNFLMIKNLGLLNTFAALVLPGLANGYYVFLLKGFFDSLPSELYEAASIDGASELRMFWNITLPLSMPVLSVIALFAFGGAYGSFLWAFTTCQDKKMWTLMVFLQQFQIEVANAPYIIMAALVLAAIPTIIVFLSAQKVLMRGIVVPTMK